MTSLHPPSPAVGRPLSCFISGRSVRLRQCREFSSLVISTSVARDTGAMLVGRGSTGAEITVLALSGCLMAKGMSSDCSGALGSTELLTGLSALILVQTRFLVEGGGQVRWQLRGQYPRVLVHLLPDQDRTCDASYSSSGIVGRTVVPLPAETEMLLSVLTINNVFESSK